MKKQIALAALLALGNSFAGSDKSFGVLSWEKFMRTTQEQIDHLNSGLETSSEFYQIPDYSEFHTNNLYVSGLNTGSFNVSTNDFLDSTSVFFAGDERAGIDYLYSKMGEEQFFEEGYLFLPRKNLWFEVGKGDEILVGDQYRLKFDEDLISKFAAVEDKLVLYHSHPFNSEKELLLLKNLESRGLEDQFDKFYRLNCLPSIEEDIDHAYKQIQWLKGINPEIVVEHRVLSNFGVANYSFNPSKQNEIGKIQNISDATPLNELLDVSRSFNSARQNKKDFQQDYFDSVVKTLETEEYSDDFLENICDAVPDYFIDLNFSPRK